MNHNIATRINLNLNRIRKQILCSLLVTSTVISSLGIRSLVQTISNTVETSVEAEETVGDRLYSTIGSVVDLPNYINISELMEMQFKFIASTVSNQFMNQVVTESVPELVVLPEEIIEGPVVEENVMPFSRTIDTELTMELDETVVEEVLVEEEIITPVINYVEPYTMYVSDVWLNVRCEPNSDTNDNIIGGLKPRSEITVIGQSTIDDRWSVIEYKGTEAYVFTKYIQEAGPVDTYNHSWTGEKLTKQNGKIAGPSGNETYYNLNMSRCVYYMNKLGYEAEVWVREDGVKMFGDYIMVAANLDIRPKGSLVETSLGTGIVVDTGDFVSWDSTGIDIAVTW